MNKVLPFVFPLIALVIVAFLAFRWYNLNTARKGDITAVGEGVQIDNLSTAEQDQILKGAGDFKSVELQPVDQTTPVTGTVRYDVKEGRVLFSVTADLPAVVGNTYQVWLRNPATQMAQKAFTLTANKGGFTGSAATQESLLPLEVVITKEVTDDAQLEQILLKGMIIKEN